ncbi:type I-E CRISPR-associated protein Cas6/Cse3/CasE [Nitrosococcus watsonii]|uniref:CRISPR-associated protein, Cse3 family n=1 Tax=Nitrosococcus watsoni (strain C-113) TaxID=105559 RepID=D8K5Y7_NITWC|nr:type I-E CRISPR-associated protein Cas6/Cse3/CasE [Nitrosococcus watsonii]ADJ28314.1 CRISPR-associated protein, Cse3 family [Nitrosococcus watsonii C-113]
MYLSKIEIDWRYARDPYQWHRSLWQLFPGQGVAERSFLFRMECPRPGQNVQLLLQSEAAPGEAAAGIRVVARRDYPLSLHSGQFLRFRLIANPIKTIRDGEGRLNRKGVVKSCRVPLLQEEQQEAWLSRKLSGAAMLESVIPTLRPPLYFRKNGKAGKLVTVTFDGVFQVVNPRVLAALIQTGIGPAKAFGCGLLSLARI